MWLGCEFCCNVVTRVINRRVTDLFSLVIKVCIVYYVNILRICAGYVQLQSYCSMILQRNIYFYLYLITVCFCFRLNLSSLIQSVCRVHSCDSELSSVYYMFIVGLLRAECKG